MKECTEMSRLLREHAGHQLKKGARIAGIKGKGAAAGQVGRGCPGQAPAGDAGSEDSPLPN